MSDRQQKEKIPGVTVVGCVTVERAHSTGLTCQIVIRKNTFHRQNMSDRQQKEYIPKAGYVRSSAERTHSTGMTCQIVSRKKIFHRRDSRRAHSTGRICQIVSRKNPFHRLDMSDQQQKDSIGVTVERAHSTGTKCHIESRKSTFQRVDLSDCQQKEHIPEAGYFRCRKCECRDNKIVDLSRHIRFIHSNMFLCPTATILIEIQITTDNKQKRI